jgi:hypothetical protein
MERVRALLERIAAGYAEGPAQELAAAAREQFLSETGRVHEDDPGFESRMAQYLEWFVIDRPEDGHAGATPIERFAARSGDPLPPEDQTALLALACSHRSLFEIAGRDAAGRTCVDDLLHGMRWAVVPEDPTVPVLVGDLFDGRLVSLDDGVHFTDAFCYHPPEAASRIRRLALRWRRRGEAGGGLLARLMRWRLVYDRSIGVPVEQIYPLDQEDRRGP